MKRTVSGGARSRSKAPSKMRRDTRKTTRYVVCIDNRNYPASLERGKVYRALSDPKTEKDGLIRVVDESGEDYLFARSMFSTVKLSKEAARALASA
jgi:hypothetical protein